MVSSDRTTNEEPDLPAPLRRILTRRPVLWLGAGASRQAEPPIPTLAELGEALKRDFVWPQAPADADPYRLFDLALAEGVARRSELSDFLERQFRPGGRDARPGELHEQLATLAGGGAFAAIVDTNYDLLLRRALQALRVPHRASVLERNLKLAADELPYLSIHGGLDDWRSIVLTEASYREFERRYRWLNDQLDLLLVQHPVVFVGCSMQDPRILDWLAGLSPADRSELKTWVAVVGPGSGDALGKKQWRPGVDCRAALGEHLQLVELPSFDDLPRWFAIASQPARLERQAAERELVIEVTAEPAGWTFSAAGSEARRAPPDLGDDLLVLRKALGFGVPVDGADDKAAGIEVALERLAAEVGDTLTALLPQEARDALDRLAAGAAVAGPALVRLRVDGLDANRVLLLPWELLRSGGGFPLARGEIDLVREVVRPGLEQGLPDAPPPLTVVSHLAAPEGDGVPPLNLEEAAFRMAQALDHLRERTRFTELGTVGDLKAAVAAVKPTLLHFAGHGLPGRLVFEDDTCAAEEVAVDELLNHLRLAAGGRLPLAVWLSCCYGAGPLGELAETLGERLAGAAAGRGASSETSREAGREWQAFTVESPSLCADLHHAGIPQVLGYFGPVPDALAVEVDRRLFEGLTGGGSGVEAVRQARLATRNPIATPEGKVRFPLAWALLALYHRGPDRPLAVPHGALPAAVEEALEPEVLQLEGVEVLRHGFIGRRRLLADLRKRRRQRERTLGLYGLGGLGKTATMTRLASILTGGGPEWHQRVLVVPAGERLRPESGEPDDPFLWLWGRIEKAMTGQGGLPEDWQQEVAEAEQTGERPRRLARLLLSALGDRVLYVDNAESL